MSFFFFFGFSFYLVSLFIERVSMPMSEEEGQNCDAKVVFGFYL